VVRAADTVGASFAEPHRGKDRLAPRGAHRSDQRVEPFHPGIAATRSLLGVAVGLTHRVIDIDISQPVRTGEQRSLPGQRREQPGVHRVELPNVSESERAQERPQRRRCPDPTEQPLHRAVAQQVQVIDTVRASDHPRDDRRHFHLREHPTRPAGEPDMLTHQLVQAGAFRHPQDREQTRARHKTRIIKHRDDFMADSHLPGALQFSRKDPSTRSILLQPQGIPCFRHANPPT